MTALRRLSIGAVLVLAHLFGAAPVRADPQQCQINVGQKVVDFGRVAVAGGTQQAPVSIGKRRFLLTVVCPDAQAMALVYRAPAARTATLFRFEDDGEYTVRLSEATLDGVNVDLGVVRVEGESPVQIARDAVMSFDAATVPVRDGLRAHGTTLAVWVEVETWLFPDVLHVQDEKSWRAEGAFDAPGLAQTQELALVAKATPTSCSPQLSNHVLSYGAISARSLSQPSVVPLMDKTVGLTITCTAKAKIAIRAVDNRQGSESPREMGNPAAFGLGMTPDHQPIGSAEIRYRDVKADSTSADVLASADHGLSWTAAPAEGALLATDAILAAGDGATKIPRAAMVHQGSLRVTSRIAPVVTRMISEVIEIDGSITIEIVYL